MQKKMFLCKSGNQVYENRFLFDLKWYFKVR